MQHAGWASLSVTKRQRQKGSTICDIVLIKAAEATAQTQHDLIFDICQVFFFTVAKFYLIVHAKTCVLMGFIEV